MISSKWEDLYLVFLPALIFSGLPAFELAVAETLALICLGFRASLLPRLLSPFDIGFPVLNATASLKRRRQVAGVSVN